MNPVLTDALEFSSYFLPIVFHFLGECSQCWTGGNGFCFKDGDVGVLLGLICSHKAFAFCVSDKVLKLVF